MKTSWVLLLGAVAGLTACHRRAAAPAPPIRPVLSIIVAPEAAGGAAFAGTVDARYESILGFRVLGRMIARDVNVGDNGQARRATRRARSHSFPTRAAECGGRLGKGRSSSAEGKIDCGATAPVDPARSDTRKRNSRRRNMSSKAPRHPRKRRRRMCASRRKSSATQSCMPSSMA